MIAIRSVSWVHEAWELTFTIHEGVYWIDKYPLRITHLAYSDDLNTIDGLSQVALALLQSHMRRGAVAPHAMVLDWPRGFRMVQQEAQSIQDVYQMVDESLKEVGSGTSSHF